MSTWGCMSGLPGSERAAALPPARHAQLNIHRTLDRARMKRSCSAAPACGRPAETTPPPHPPRPPPPDGVSPPAGKLYPEGLPIWGEDELEAVIKEHRVDRCLLAYSDLPHRCRPGPGPTCTPGCRGMSYLASSAARGVNARAPRLRPALSHVRAPVAVECLFCGFTTPGRDPAWH